MNELVKVFECEEFGKVRTILKDDELWFVGKDIAEILGYKDTAYAISNHCKGVGEISLPSKGGNQMMKIIPENRWNNFSLELILTGRGPCKARKPLCMECHLLSLCPYPETAMKTQKKEI